jgi:hypothetical protein
MMKWRNTWLLAGLALALLAFIVLVERHTGTSQPPVTLPVRLLPRLKAAEVTAVVVRRTNQFVLRAERNGESWRLTAPLAYPAAPVAIERLLTTLEQVVTATHLSPREMASRGQKLADFGLDAPPAVITLEQGADRQELQFGARTTAGDQIYAQVVGAPGISVVETALLDLLPPTVDDWRNLALFELSGWDFDRVEIVKTNGGMYLTRDATNGAWQLSRPRLRADQLKVEGLLEKLHQARVTQFVTDDLKADLDSFGLQNPPLELVLGRGTNQAQRVQFGKSPANDTTNVYARRLSQTNVVLVAKSLLDTLNTPAAEFRDRRLLAFAPNLVTLIEARSEEPFTIRRQTNDLWLAGESVPADPFFMQDWLQRLSQLQVTEFVKDVVTDFASYGLAPPRRQYVLKTSVTNAAGATNVVIGELQFGTNTSDKIFVRRADEDSVYAIRYLDYFRMPAAAWQLRDRRVWTFTTNQVARVTLRQNGRSRVLLRGPNGDWTIAPGSQGIINPLAAEEMVFRLGELYAVMWAARGKENLPQYGFAETNLQIAVELKLGEKTQTLTLDFGGAAPSRFPYAAALVDGQVWIFEFPWFLFQDLERAFGLPLGDVRTVSPPDCPGNTVAADVSPRHLLEKDISADSRPRLHGPRSQLALLDSWSAPPGIIRPSGQHSLPFC